LGLPDQFADSFHNRLNTARLSPGLGNGNAHLCVIGEKRWVGKTINSIASISSPDLVQFQEFSRCTECATDSEAEHSEPVFLLAAPRLAWNCHFDHPCINEGLQDWVPAYLFLSFKPLRNCLIIITVEFTCHGDSSDCGTSISQCIPVENGIFDFAGLKHCHSQNKGLKWQ
jgi:hypothetical protein